MGVYAMGKFSITSSGTEILRPVMGTAVMDSTPPATITSADPKATRSAAWATAWSPLEQKRLMVIAAVSTGRPASSPTTLAMLSPCSPSGMAHPRIRSSTSAGAICGTLARSSRTTVPARSSGRVSASAPLWARPTALRTAAAITTSVMAGTPSVAQGLVVEKHVLHPLARLLLAAQPEKALAFQFQHPGLGDGGGCTVQAAAQDRRDLHRHLAVVLRRLATLLERQHHHLQGRDAALARELVRPRCGRVPSRLGQPDGPLLRVVQQPRAVEGHAVRPAEVPELFRFVRAGGDLGQGDVLEHLGHQRKAVDLGAFGQALQRTPQEVHAPTASRHESDAHFHQS